MELPSRTETGFRLDALNEWRPKLGALDIEFTAEVLTPLKRALELRSYAASVARDAPAAFSPEAEAITALSNGSAGFEESADIAFDAVRTAALPPASPTDAAAILARAAEHAGNVAWARLKTRGNANVETLRGPYMATANAVIELWATIPEGTLTIEHAARARVAEEWAALEEYAEQLATIRGLFRQWCADGIIPTDGARGGGNPFRGLAQYKDQEFFYEDPTAAMTATAVGHHGSYRAHSGGPVGIARALTAGRPALRTVAEVDAAFSSTPTVTEEAHEDASAKNWRADNRAREEHRKTSRPRAARGLL